MTSPPTILILEDERAQLLTVKAALRGLGEIKEFSDPHAALIFLQQQTADAAIVDIHMPRFEIDGIDFIRSVRKFDRDLCVIVRTGDNSTELADDAIEVRAFYRAIKSKTTVDELRSLTAAAVMETRSRRQVTTDAANTAHVKTQWVQTLGSAEEGVSVTESYKGLFQAMRNRLTAIAGVAAVMNEAIQHNRTDLVTEYAAKNHLLVGGLLTEVNGFLDGPFAEALHAARTDSPATTNAVLETLRKHFLASPKWNVDQKSVIVSGLSQDMYISASPLKLLTAIRHLVEFCLERSASNATIRLTAHCIDSSRAIADSIRGSKLVFTERPINDSVPCVAFHVCADLATVSLEEIRRSFDEYPDDPRSGNLQMIPLALHNDLNALIVRLAETGAAVFELHIPVSR